MSTRTTAPGAPGRPGQRAGQRAGQYDSDSEARRRRQRRFEDAMNEADAQDRIDRTTGKVPTKSTGGAALSQESLRF
tara:strand:+ start:1778 stop:2008 length:231 start_codon:yes stop_codon:yes gene_type:complete